MAYQAIYRKWRPAVFEDVVGQQHITKTLQNQLESGKISHAYLFCGTRGTGKTTVAKILARAINCQNPKGGSPCNECSVCRGISDGSILDVFEIDAASNNGVDNIREIIEDAKYVASEAKYRVYIIDEVHMLSQGAFNALLKTLEEPPEHTVFILATTEAHKVPQTILSRCQRFDFKRINTGDIVRRMREIAMGEGLSITDDAYSLLSQLADGSMRDGLTILERCVSETDGTLTYESVSKALGISGNAPLFAMADAVNSGNSGEIFEIIEQLMSDGRDLNNFIGNLIGHYRNLLICKVTDKTEKLIDREPKEIVKLKAQAERTSFEKLSGAISILSGARNEAKWAKEPRTIYELALIKLTRPELDASYDALLDRIKALEEKVKEGIKVQVQRAEKPPEQKSVKKAKQPSARLFVPFDVNSFTQDTPCVAAARGWDKISRQISKKYPFISSAVLGRRVTIDGEGIILIFEKDETMSKELAKTHRAEIEELIAQAIGSRIVAKTAFLEDIEDNIIDFWKIGEKKDTNSNTFKDLDERFPEIVEDIDSSEFISYEPQNDDFEQVEIEGEEDEEEFLEENERESEE
ncbi:MAG: DNA polymerase III subunit gamma/tau [Firmicutes bacterium]|nr:DNA polymerase III subunit gamma/tau [Bacillota bacterium]